MVAVVGWAPAAQLTVLTLARENKPGHRINSDTATHAKHWRSRIFKYINDKFALLWGEAQKKITYSYPMVTYSYPKVT